MGKFMKIENFNDLLKATTLQAQPQRLLFLFAKATAMKNAVASKHQSGTIDPVMCVDKLPEDIASFEALVIEADGITNKWDFVFIGCLDGVDGLPPSTEDAGPFLKIMSNNLASGKDIAKYIVLDREQKQVILA
jgi:hypothetical protein